MKINRTALTMLVSFALAAALAFAPPAEAKKSEQGGLKKVVAIGHAEMGDVGFSNVDPSGVGELFRMKAKELLEKTGRYVVVLPKPGKEKEPAKSAPSAPAMDMAMEKPPTSAAEAQAYMQKMMEMQKEFQKDSMRMQGKYVHSPVAAQGLYNFSSTQSHQSVSSGGVFSLAETMGAPSGVGHADFSSDRLKISISCTELDPESGSVTGEHTSNASTTQATTVGGTSYYTVVDSSDPDRAFQSLYSRALKECVRWIDQRMAGKAWEGQVFKAKGGELYLNAGTRAGVSEGMSLDAYSSSEASGRGVSFASQSKTGTLEVTSAFDDYSVARAVSGKAGEGSIVRMPN